MAIKKIEPSERFDLTTLFYPLRDRFTADQPLVHETRNHDRTYYTCITCGQKIRFNLKDFVRGPVVSATHFVQMDDDEFLVAEKQYGLTGMKFKDFYCPECRNPVRVYYDSWISNDGYCELKAVLEGQKNGPAG